MLPGKLKGVDRRLVSNSHGVVMQTGTGFVGTKFETEAEVFIPNIFLKSTDGKLAWYRRLLLIPWGIKRIVTWEAHLKVSIVKAVTGARSSWGRAWQRGCKLNFWHTQPIPMEKAYWGLVCVRLMQQKKMVREKIWGDFQNLWFSVLKIQTVWERPTHFKIQNLMFFKLPKKHRKEALSSVPDRRRTYKLAKIANSEQRNAHLLKILNSVSGCSYDRGRTTRVFSGYFR